MRIFETSLELPFTPDHRPLIPYFARALNQLLEPHQIPVRFVVSSMHDNHYQCEVGILDVPPHTPHRPHSSIFNLRRRRHHHCASFNAVFMIPTGIGCELGGHAGDANAAASIIAEGCDTLITHPNVVNASDVIDLPPNALYVEGSVLTRLLMGTVSLAPTRANRVLAIIDDHPDTMFTNAAINAVSAARSSYGLISPPVTRLSPSVELVAHYAGSGRATGEVRQIRGLIQKLHDHRDEYDAIAISTQVKVPTRYHTEYFEARGEMINPWGGAEAIFTHTLSEIFAVPTAHSPMLEDRTIAHLDPGQVDPRMAAEAISTTFFMCVLRGLQRSPRIIPLRRGQPDPQLLNVEDISVIITPDKALGLPTLAALEQNIPVIAVRENRNILGNRLEALPWATNQIHFVDNYCEAAGVMLALKSGRDPASARRPLQPTLTRTWNTSAEQPGESSSSLPHDPTLTYSSTHP